MGTFREATFGELLKRLRLEAGLTQERLAERAHLSAKTLAGLERRPDRIPRLETVNLLANALGLNQEQRARLLATARPETRSARSAAEAQSEPVPPTPRAGESPPSDQHRLARPREDWGEAPDVGEFHGRAFELATFTRWVTTERCRLLALLGMGGIGKTALTARLARDLAPQFDAVYWRSLRNALPFSEWLAGAILFLSNQQVLPAEGQDARLRQLFDLLCSQRCLLVLDNLETVLEPGTSPVGYRPGYSGYGQAFQSLQAGHESCLVLTSRELPSGLGLSTGAQGPVRALRLGGIDVAAGRALVTDKKLTGDAATWEELVGRYGGNPLALQVVGETIRALFGGEIATFLALDEAVFGDIRQLLDAQIARLSRTERAVFDWLAIEREPIDFGMLLADLNQALPRGEALEALEGLRRRSLLERGERGATFTLQPVVLEHATEQLVERWADEVSRGQPMRLMSHAVIKAQAKEYVRRSQERLSGTPILERLKARLGEAGAEQHLLALLEQWRGQLMEVQGYGPGNVVNLLRLLRGNLRSQDLSRLAIRQAYLAEVDAQDTSLVNSHLAETVLADAFTSPISVVLSSDGALLAVGTSTGEVWLWRVADRTLVATLEGYTGQVFGVAFAAEGSLLASGGMDGRVRLWETSTRRLLATLEGHTGGITGVAFSADARLLVSSSFDKTLRLWDVSTGRTLGILEGHTGTVWKVALSADGRLVVSGSSDGTVRLWEAPSGRLLATLAGHTDEVWSVALAGNGQLLASGSLDETVRLWETSTGRLLATLQSHTGGVRAVALSADGHLLASGGADGTVRIWEASTGYPLATLQGHESGVTGLALSADGLLLASGSLETVRLWETSSGQPLATLQGHADGVWRVALSGDGRIVARTTNGEDGRVRLWETESGRPLTSIPNHAAGIAVVALSADGHLVAGSGDDGLVRLWELPDGRLIATLHGHTSEVWCLAMSANGHLVASGSLDETVRIWESSTGRSMATLRGHSGGVRVVALSADGQILASGGADGTLRLWETRTGCALATLQAHTGGVRSVALSADGQLMASGGLEGIVQLWETSTGRRLASLEGHTNPVWGVALSADGQMVASSSADGTVRLWETKSGLPLATLRGHTGPVPGVALSTDGHLVASGGWDGTVRLWAAPGGAHLRTLRTERRYERTNITGLTGITEAQHSTLLALGAVEL